MLHDTQHMREHQWKWNGPIFLWPCDRQGSQEEEDPFPRPVHPGRFFSHKKAEAACRIVSMLVMICNTLPEHCSVLHCQTQPDCSFLLLLQLQHVAEALHLHTQEQCTLPGQTSQGSRCVPRTDMPWPGPALTLLAGSRTNRLLYISHCLCRAASTENKCCATSNAYQDCLKDASQFVFQCSTRPSSAALELGGGRRRVATFSRGREPLVEPLRMRCAGRPRL